MKKNMKNKNGFTLIELLLVLGVVIALITVSFAVFSKLYTKYLIYQQISNDQTIIAGIQNLYSSGKGGTNGNGFDGLSNTVLVDANIYPSSMLSKEEFNPGKYRAVPLNAFKGSIVVSTDGIVSAKTNKYEEIFFDYNESISQSACVGYTIDFYNAFKDKGLLNIYVNLGTAYTNARYQEILNKYNSTKYKSTSSFDTENLKSYCDQRKSVSFVAEFEG